MEELRNNLHLVRSLRTFVEAKNEHYYRYTVINEKSITDNTISIVMTAHERSKQVYFTLETINRCTFKDIQVIIVDDSSNDMLIEEKLREFNIHIELISIKREHKYWANPCVNYNIGFQYIRGGKVVIQNSEVCYVGDILNYVNNSILDNNYYAFDIKASRDFKTNEIIYSVPLITTSIYNENIYSMWYQHPVARNKFYHFLTALTKDTFNKIGGFSYDYSFGSSYDDDDYVLKIKHNSITLINVKNETENIGGIHLYHGYTHNITNTNAYTKQMNDGLYNKKISALSITNKYLELSDYEDYNELKEAYNRLNSY